MLSLVIKLTSQFLPPPPPNIWFQIQETLNIKYAGLIILIFAILVLLVDKNVMGEGEVEKLIALGWGKTGPAYSFPGDKTD